MKNIIRNTADPFRSILENNPHPMWIFDHETLAFLEVNPAAVAKYGYSRAEFLKMKITEIRPTDHIPRLLAEHKRFQLNRTHFGEWQHVLKDGSLIDVEITAYPLHLNGRHVIVVNAQDITERKQAQETLRRLAVSEERNRIAKEIHDTLAQAFTGILVQLEAARDVILSNVVEANHHIVQASNVARQSLNAARRSVWQLRDHALQKGDLASAIKRLSDRAIANGISVECSTKGRSRIVPEDIEDNLFRISQEALTNITRHAQATKIRIKLNFHPKHIRLVLQDNGKGFNPVRCAKGFGLISMRERAQNIGGVFTLSSKRWKGTKIAVQVQA